jgi:hypothetical protein
MTTIYILWIRQLKRYMRSRARIIASLGQPLLFLLGLGFGMGPVFQKAGQGSYIQFLAPGIVGTAIAARLADFQGFQLIVNLLVMPMFFLSGALFPLHDLPIPMAVITSINPLSFGVDGLRYSLTGITHFSLGTDLMILIGLTGGLLALGGYLFSRIEL